MGQWSLLNHTASFEPAAIGIFELNAYFDCSPGLFFA